MSKEPIEGGNFKNIPKEKVIGFITIAYVKPEENPGTPPQLRYETQNIPPMSLPTLLRKVARNIEEDIMKIP